MRIFMFLYKILSNYYFNYFYFDFDFIYIFIIKKLNKYTNLKINI